MKEKLDGLIRAARRLSCYSSNWFSEIVVENKKGEFCYTNGHVLLSDFERTPESLMGIDIRSLEKSKISNYPAIERVISDTQSGKLIEIPEDFYQYLKVWNTKAKRDNYRVFFREGEIEVNDAQKDADMQLSYREVDNKGIPEVVFMLDYVKILKPKSMWILSNQKPVLIGGSYDKIVDRYKIKLLMSLDLRV